MPDARQRGAKRGAQAEIAQRLHDVGKALITVLAGVGGDRGFFQARAAWWSCAAESISPGARSVMAWNSRSASSLWLMRRNRKASSRELDIGGIEIESPAEFVNVRIAGGQQFAGSFSR